MYKKIFISLLIIFSTINMSNVSTSMNESNNNKKKILLLII